MANDFSRGSVSSTTRRFLLFAFFLCYLRSAEVLAGSIAPEGVAIGNVRPINVDDESKPIFSKSAEIASSADLTEETLDDPGFDGFIRSFQKNRHELRNSFFTKKNGDDEIFDKNFNDFFDLGEDESAKPEVAGRSEDDRLTMLGERPVVLPVRFIYVAREFYRSWIMPTRPANDLWTDVDGRNSEGDRKRGEEDEESEDDSWEPKEDEKKNDDNVEGKKTGLGWRNIIGAPTSGCPPGERKDRNGRCRMMLW